MEVARWLVKPLTNDAFNKIDHFSKIQRGCIYIIGVLGGQHGRRLAVRILVIPSFLLFHQSFGVSSLFGSSPHVTLSFGA